MLSLKDLFQWERFITPSIIKLFYWLAVIVAALVTLCCIASGIRVMTLDPFLGFLMLLGSVVGFVTGVVIARIVAEFVLIVFRINEHLGAIRNRGEGM
jgi:hypothetical protein